MEKSSALKLVEILRPPLLSFGDGFQINRAQVGQLSSGHLVIFNGQIYLVEKVESVPFGTWAILHFIKTQQNLLTVYTKNFQNSVYMTGKNKHVIFKLLPYSF